VELGDYNAFFADLPREMLLLLKVQNLFRVINKTLGGTTAERLRILFDHAVRGVHTLPPPVPLLRRFFSYLVCIVELVLLRIRLWIIGLHIRSSASAS
jgi:hypothetical protein